MKVAVLGGGGRLGRDLIPRLEASGHAVTSLGRTGPLRVDLATGENLAESISGSEIIVHLASDPGQPELVDLGGTGNLLQAMTGQRLVYLSIVGVDRHPYPYYRVKQSVEELIEKSGESYSIMRATQFHQFIGLLIDLAITAPVPLLKRGFVYQPVDIGEVAAALASVVEDQPRGHVPDIAGPEVLTVEHLVDSYARTRGLDPVQLPDAGNDPSDQAFCAGSHTNPEALMGKVTWGDFLLGLEERDR